MANEGGEVRYITGYAAGKAAWYFLRLAPEHYQKYKKDISSKSLSLEEYGEILASGWGEAAPDHVMEHMKKLYRLNFN